MPWNFFDAFLIYSSKLPLTRNSHWWFFRSTISPACDSLGRFLEKLPEEYRRNLWGIPDKTWGIVPGCLENSEGTSGGVPNNTLEKFIKKLPEKFRNSWSNCGKNFRKYCKWEIPWGIVPFISNPWRNFRRDSWTKYWRSFRINIYKRCAEKKSFVALPYVDFTYTKRESRGSVNTTRILGGSVYMWKKLSKLSRKIWK